MSIAGGLYRAVERAVSIDATALQVFVKSARQWDAPPLVADAIRDFRAAVDGAGLRDHTLAHASYLINLASPDAALRRRSSRALGDEVERCSALGIPFLVLHPGSHVGDGEEPGLQRVVEGLDRVLLPASARTSKRRCGVTVLLEITAGQGTNLGHRLEHLALILERAESSPRLGVCFDTCHALAAGHDFRDRDSFRRTLRRFDRIIGLDRLFAFHLNDSKTGLGSRRDRHEHIGQGEVGLEGFRLILNHRRFRDLPMVLETPKGEQGLEDRRNLGRLRALLPEGRR